MHESHGNPQKTSHSAASGLGADHSARACPREAFRGDIETLRGEVARLRSEARTAKLFAMLASGGLIVGLLAMTAPQAARVIQTKRLEIVDDAGRVTMVATSAAQGGRLDFWNATGANTARLGSNEAGGDFILWKNDGSAALSAYAQSNGGRIEVGMPGNRVAGLLEASALGGRMSLANSAGNPMVGAAALEQGGAIRVADRDNKDAALLRAGPHGGGLDLVAPNGVAMARLSAAEAGGEFDLAARTGSARVSLSANEREAIVVALSEAGASKLESSARGASVDLVSRDSTRLVSLEANTGGGALVCRTATGNAAASIGANPALAKGGLMQIYNDRQETVLAAAVNADGAGRLAIGTAAGDATLIAESGKDDGGSLSLNRGGRRAIAFLAGTNGGLLNLFSAAGMPVVVAGAAEDAAGGVVAVRSTEGRDLVRIGVDERGSGNVTLFNRDASERKSVAGPR